MKSRTLAAVLVCSAGAAWAWQEAYARLNVDRVTSERLVTNYVHEAVRAGGHFAMPPLPGSKIVLGLSDTARAALVRECGLAARAFIMSPAFQAAYDEHIKNVYRAVNHGIQVSSAGAGVNAAWKKGDYAAAQAAGTNMMRDNFRKSVIERLPSLAKYDKGAIEIMAEAGAGLMDEASVNDAAARSRREEEQANYNQYSLRPNQKKKLLAFAAFVKTVDFNSATTMKDGKRVFVNRAYEGRDEFWKLLYRLGPGGANAAAQLAQQRAAEL